LAQAAPNPAPPHNSSLEWEADGPHPSHQAPLRPKSRKGSPCRLTAPSLHPPPTPSPHRSPPHKPEVSPPVSLQSHIAFSARPPSSVVSVRSRQSFSSKIPPHLSARTPNAYWSISAAYSRPTRVPTPLFCPLSLPHPADAVRIPQNSTGFDSLFWFFVPKTCTVYSSLPCIVVFFPVTAYGRINSPDHRPG